jgi:hypothetical protein
MVKLLAIFIQCDTFVLCGRVLVPPDMIDGRAKNAGVRSVFFVLNIRANSQMPRVAAEFLCEDNHA